MWQDQVAKLCRGVFFTLRRLWTFSHFIPVETRRKLGISLIVPQFLYGDVLFSMVLAAIRGRLMVALNACARYNYGISRYQHISEHANRILGCSLDTYYNLRICCVMYRLIGSGRPGYLFDGLQFGRSARFFNLIIPSHRTSARVSPFFVQGAILWNMVCHQRSEERAARGGLGTGVRLVCVDLQLLVMCEFFFLLFLSSISFLFSFGSVVLLLFLLIF
jgi:hypothetical protein